MENFRLFQIANQLEYVTVNGYQQNLAAMFPDGELSLGELERKDVCQQLYTQLRTTPTKKTGKPPATDTHKNCLSQTKTFMRWCVAYPQEYIKANAFDEIKGLGKRNRGKEQISFDEAPRFLMTCIIRANCGDQGAVAALMCLCVGLRATEVARLRSGDIDLGGTLLHIRKGKTAKSVRKRPVPPLLRPYLAQLRKGKSSDDFLWDPARNGSGWATGKIIEALTVSGEEYDAVTMAARTGIGHEVCQSLLYRLVKNRLAVRTERGKYRAATENGPAALGVRRPRREGWQPKRHWILSSVKRLCREAGVKIVCAHAMRGMFTTLVSVSGMDALLKSIADAVGHENKSTTINHYMNRDALAGEEQNRAMEMLIKAAMSGSLKLPESGNETKPFIPGPVSN